MAVHDFTSERLYVAADLAADATVVLTADQAHYLLNVLRMAAGSEILVFNGRHGEWRARLEDIKKRSAGLRILAQTRPQTGGPAIHYLFAPLKHARLDYMVQKAVELGVARLSPVMTRRTVPGRVNIERMRLNAIEAAEQCGVLRIPETDDAAALTKTVEDWASGTPLIFCDEDAPVRNPIAALGALAPGPVAVLIGPEGGFDVEERRLLLSKPFVTALSLGPRIMRADTAAVAALTLVNATLGDWR
ncbi:MAG: 16S rRNA (uracil(1498)-N(3))-methyltransferase [Hyphomicrobium sp.]|jgi:16S rRNA (uracil1498-N3)-methyltransferase|nr:16S rRNA (uracil(1498)-N(3))-methyltransferase [Hyphomicrobium sp.]